MNVTHVVFSLEVGGLERNVVNQIRASRVLGQYGSVVCLEGPGELAPQVTALGGAVVSLGKRPGVRLSAIGNLRRAFQRLRTDVVHTHQIPTLFYAGPAARSLRLPVVHTEHGLPLFENRARTRWLGRFAACGCDRFFCLTQEIADVVKQYRVVPRRKILLICNGIETAKYGDACDSRALRGDLGIPDGAAVIGAVGRLVEVKRFELLIHSFHRVRAHGLNAHLVIVGEGPLRAALQQLTKDLGLAGYVHLAGYRTNVNEFLHAFDCFALVSRSEGTPQVLLEAAMARLPIVASRVGGVPEIIEHERTGLLFPSGEEDALTRELLRILGDKDLATRLGDCARRRVESLYGIERMSKVYHEHYLELLAGNLSHVH